MGKIYKQGLEIGIIPPLSIEDENIYLNDSLVILKKVVNDQNILINKLIDQINSLKSKA